MAYSPDGKRLASAAGEGKEPDEVKVWEPATRRLVISLKAHTKAIRCLAFSPAGKRLASASVDAVIVWDAVSGEKLLTFRAHSKSVNCVAFSPDGQRIATGAGDAINYRFPHWRVGPVAYSATALEEAKA
jgi:WD40 repeat protein